MEGAVSKRRKAFAAAHRSDEDRQVYISASRRAPSVIAKAEAWQMTCSSLSPKNYTLGSDLVLLPLGSHCGGGHTRSSVSIGALV